VRIPPHILEDVVRNALEEDIGTGDLTSECLIPKDLWVKAEIISKDEGILAGIEVAELSFKLIDERVEFHRVLEDGSRIYYGSKIAYLNGPARAILSGERVALNFLCSLSGIATETRRFVEAVKPYKAKIADTRKTTPGIRVLQKYAVRVGGGVNHRFGLYDGIIIKDNHIKIVGSIREAVRMAKEKAPPLAMIEVEVEDLEQFEEAFNAGADIIMLDNFDLEDIRKAVEKGCGRVIIEASGGVSLENVKDIAEAGVDIISVGALTHSAPSLDITLEIIKFSG